MITSLGYIDKSRGIGYILFGIIIPNTILYKSKRVLNKKYKISEVNFIA